MKTLGTFMLLLCLPLMADFTGRVVGVSDGDTVKVMNGGEEVKVRLSGIDCPEKKQAFGQKAKEFTSGFCFGKDVMVKERGKDRYGRTLGNVEVDGKDLGMDLVQAGLAWHYVQYSKDKALAAAEAKAREAKVGLWADGMAVPPWKWRKHKQGGN